MIYVSGSGQMCNNMLQFGHFYAFGKENKLNVCGLRFCYKYLYFELSDSKNYSWKTYLLAKYLAKIGFIPKINFDCEVNLPFQKSFLLNKKSVFVSGWLFREYDLFIKYREEIKALFAFKKNVIESINTNILASINYKLGVHIRRGDYSTWLDGKYFFTDNDYINLIKSFLNNLNILVDIIIVTNDHKIDKTVYNDQMPNVNVNFADGNQAQDLYILSNCDYIIGPPSTFSLMASFYHDKPIYWIYDKDLEITNTSFRFFDEYFRNII